MKIVLHNTANIPDSMDAFLTHQTVKTFQVKKVEKLQRKINGYFIAESFEN